MTATIITSSSSSLAVMVTDSCRVEQQQAMMRLAMTQD
jgi:hypothetical protein